MRNISHADSGGAAVRTTSTPPPPSTACRSTRRGERARRAAFVRTIMVVW